MRDISTWNIIYVLPDCSRYGKSSARVMRTSPSSLTFLLVNSLRIAAAKPTRTVPWTLEQVEHLPNSPRPELRIDGLNKLPRNMQRQLLQSKTKNLDRYCKFPRCAYGTAVILLSELMLIPLTSPMQRNRWP